MSTTRTSRALFFLLGCAALAAAWVAFGGGPSGGAAVPPAATAAAAEPADRPPDREAVRKALDSFVAAFQKGDGKAVAAHWTAEGEYIGDDGVTFRGRPALEKEYARLFAQNPGDTLGFEVESVRFPSRDNAVVEGYFKLRKAKGGELVVSRCSFLYAREEGKWLIAIAREWPGDGLSLRDLEWLVGTWEAKRDGTAVVTKYEWTANKSFLRCEFSLTQDGKTDTGVEVFGKDPSTGVLRVWTFADEGGIGERVVTRDGKKWVQVARGVTGDGRVLTATNIVTPVDADTFLWQAVERTLDDEPLPDLPPVKVVRVKAKP